MYKYIYSPIQYLQSSHAEGENPPSSTVSEKVSKANISTTPLQGPNCRYLAHSVAAAVAAVWLTLGDLPLSQ